MKNNCYIKKKVFLETLDAVYQTASIDYLRALYEGLHILYFKRVNGSTDFKDYGGYIKI